MRTSEHESRHELPVMTLRGGHARLPHPVVFILLWVMLVVAMQSLQVAALLSAGILLTLLALNLSSIRLYALVRRTRWIMLSLLVIYGYVTPGEALWAQGGIFSPTQQGLVEGMLQLGRLLFALAGLSIVLYLLPQPQLMSGIYVLAYPLRYLGLSRERLAVRLALTLHYAETAMADTAADWRGNMERMLAPAEIAPLSMTLHLTPFTLRDGLLLAAGCTLSAWVLL